MIQHSLEKIEKLIKQRQQPLPEIMLKLYALVLLYAKKIQQKSSEHLALELYGDALKLFRNYLVQQPFKLTKVTTLKISQSLMTQQYQNLAEIFELKNRFIKQLSVFGPTDAFGKRILSELSDLKWAKKLEAPLEAALLLKKQIEQKKGNISYISEISSLLWFGQLKGQYLVDINTFIDKLIQFCYQYFPMLDFLQENSVFHLQNIIDPQSKYYLTAFNCDQFFTKIRCNDLVNSIWQNCQYKVQPQPFISQSSMVIRLVNDSLPDRIIGVTGQKILIGQQQKDVKMPPVVLIGSSADCDIVLKSKYISRKQLAIIEDKRQEKLKNSDSSKYNFSIVCLSQTNFTSISYPTKIKVGVGLIFFGENTKYQVMNIERIQLSMQEIKIDQDDKTLSILPGQIGPKSFKSHIESITFLILSGEHKGTQLVFKIKSLQTKNEQNNHEKVFREILLHEEEIYLKPKVRILGKTANEIVENRLSRKIRLKKDMEIFLEQYKICIE